MIGSVFTTLICSDCFQEMLTPISCYMVACIPVAFGWYAHLESPFHLFVSTHTAIHISLRKFHTLICLKGVRGIVMVVLGYGSTHLFIEFVNLLPLLACVCISLAEFVCVLLSFPKNRDCFHVVYRLEDTKSWLKIA